MLSYWRSFSCNTSDPLKVTLADNRLFERIHLLSIKLSAYCPYVIYIALLSFLSLSADIKQHHNPCLVRSCLCEFCTSCAISSHKGFFYKSKLGNSAMNLGHGWLFISTQNITMQYIWFIYSLTHLPWTKWPSFRRRYFQMHFREWKVLYFNHNFTKFIPKGPIDNKSSNGLDNGLAPNRRQAYYLNQSWPVSPTHMCDIRGEELNCQNYAMVEWVK